MVSVAFADDSLSEVEWRSQPLGTVRLGGELGRRQQITVTNNLLKINYRDEFLKPFVEKKLSCGYLALGKFIDASVALAKVTGREDVRSIKEEAVRTVLAHQLPDGYPGALVPKSRLWEAWDAHEIAYLIYGLMSDWEEFGTRAALDGARKAADWVLANWHTKPADWGKTFVNEPMYTIGQCRAMLRVYRATGDQRYLDFVLKERNLADRLMPIVFGRAPMMWGHMYTYLEDCLAQQMLWRIRPDDKFLRQTHRAFDMLLDGNGAVVTGGAGIAEAWTDSQDGDGDVGETCATVYGLFTADSMIRIGKGDSARLGDYMERTIWNALFAAQSPDGRRIRYYTPLLGHRAYFKSDTFCCPNNYRRLIARLSDFTLYTRPDAVYANLYSPLVTICELNGVSVAIREITDYPRGETVAFEFAPAQPVEFEFSFRIPGWSKNPSVTLNGRDCGELASAGGIRKLRRRWQQGDRVELRLPMTIRPVAGRVRQAGRIAFLRGPLVYAFNPASAKRSEHPFDIQSGLQVDPATCLLKNDTTVRPDGTAIELKATFNRGAVGVAPYAAETIRLTEFADPEATVTYFRTPLIARDGVADELFK